ncbi:MAG TPA: hypothetical protein P5287_03410 [bacterium]|nr:hypothetical protein [bacterium]
MADEVKQDESTPAAPAEGAAPAAEAKKKEVPPAIPSGKNSRPKACSQCNKALKRKTWYYRHGKYFCNKRCWKTSTQPKETKAA